MPEAIHFQLLQAAQAQIRELRLDGIVPSNVVLLQVPTDSKTNVPDLPAIVVAPFGRETFGQGTNASDDIQYPILIAILDAANQVQDTGLNKRLLWRQQLIDHFIHNRMEIGVSDRPWDQEIEPLDVVEPNAWFQRQLYVSSFVVRVKVRKLRRA